MYPKTKNGIVSAAVYTLKNNKNLEITNIPEE